MAVVEPDPVVEGHDGVRGQVPEREDSLAAVFQLKNRIFPNVTESKLFPVELKTVN